MLVPVIEQVVQRITLTMLHLIGMLLVLRRAKVEKG